MTELPLMTALAAVAPVTSATSTERTLVFLGGGPLWLQLGVWLLGALVVALTVRNHRKLEPPSRRRMMVALRTGLVLLLTLFFYQPACLEERVAVNRNAVIVLTDASQSMSLPHAGSTRGALADKWLSDHEDFFAGLAETRDVHRFAFAELLEERASRGAETRISGRETRALDALKGLRDRFRNQDIGGIILLTDGIDTTAEGRRTTLSPELEATLRDLAAPVTSLTTAGDPSIRDLAIAHLASNNFAFLLNATSIEATVEVHGYPEGQLSIRLLENGVEVASQLIATRPQETNYKVKFDFVPKKLGKQVYTVTIEPLPDEVYGKNNQRSAIINVVRDKIRVVQIVGQPSWDERHLRNLLKENPNVDLVSFFILVNRMNFRPLSSRETSLIPFPAKELFEDELGGFDLLIFQNFNYGPFQTREYLPNIAKFVRDGGAFVMVGGPLSFSAGGYYGTEITDVLPLEIPSSFGSENATDEREFPPRLTESGAFHPITRLALDPAQNKRIWSDIHPLEGVNLSTSAKDGAVVLVEHPELRTSDGKPMPVVAVAEAGEGRSMAVATDSTWFWNFKAGEAQDPHHYQAFWENAIRWLIKDPELDLLKVRALRETVPLGEQADVLITALLADYRPAASQKVEVTVRRRAPGDDRGQGEVVSKQTELSTDAQGELRLELPVAAAGIYEVEVRANIVKGRTTTAFDLFVGVDQNPELERVVGDERLVTGLAKSTGGAVLAVTAAPSEIPLEEPTVMRVKSRTHQELWSAPWALLLAALLFGLEWWLRRRFGYL
jgi:uncharacterized membrane protein